MTMTDFIAVLALLVGSSSLLWTWLVAYRNRRRVVVTATTGTTATPGPDGVYNQIFASVTVRSVGKSVGIDNISFDWTEPPPTAWGVSGVEELTRYDATKRIDISDVHGTRRVLQDGAIASWHFRIQVPQGNSRGVDEAKELRAVVTLTSGKKVLSNKFWITPDKLIPNGESQPPRSES